MREDSRALDEELATDIKFQDLCKNFTYGFLVLKTSPDNITCRH